MLSWIMFAVRSIGVSNKSPCKPYPALFSKMSTVTDLASRLHFKRLAAPGEARSIASTSTFTPYFRRRSEASFSIDSCRRATNTRLTFCAASRSANSKPRPPDAPVIRARFPAKLFVSTLVGLIDSFDIVLSVMYLIDLKGRKRSTLRRRPPLRGAGGARQEERREEQEPNPSSG